MAKKAVVTPWEVKGDIDYDKLVKEFGVSPMRELPAVFNKNLLFRRNIVFAHRDIQRILEAVKSKKKFVMMTGLMPTGRFHIGHMILAQQMIFYQKLGAKLYIAVADVEAYLARGQSIEESRKIAIEEYVLNYIALGLKPENCEIYFQSDRAKDSKKANAYYRLQNLLSGHATFNEFKAVYGEISPGKMLAALLQAADMLHPQLPEFEGGPVPTFIPVGIDQDPHIRLARDISQRIKGHKFIQLSSTYHRFMPGLKGGKMSASDPLSFVALTDSPTEVKKKINKYAFSGGQATVEEHRKKGGNPDVDVSYQWLTFIEEDDKKLEKVYKDYKSGKLLTGELKKILSDELGKFLFEHEKKRGKARNVLDKFVQEKPDTSHHR
ncbi:MAG: tryptophan--tRNA ligase [Candidatus Woesearchaeota archaeon]|jgi:tryptophanyl-tRNA synthetase|nr:tryptophan--tRNA ligase [Candidatus Woesearchaeota archaeon]MDP7505851.1 tryptophan--tRNA ligase [Candidatus Woesearchaeota archaeon]MDP7610621.1 tryptophan--tRNA ligase [Candidatus Woesearchaeota archaeon]|tara:strand:- start:2080 stop:3219 length:1140 start_codon:yes stop_codon:yes gene_type:complete